MSLWRRLLVAGLAALCGCSLVTPFDVSRDAPPTDGDADADVDPPTDGDTTDGDTLDGDSPDGDLPDGDAPDGGSCPLGPGPLTFVATTSEVSLERVFDLDGDGTKDNAIGDLGASDGSGWVTALTSLFNGAIVGGLVFMVHVPRLADRPSRTDPAAIAIMTYGVDTDVPVDVDDDFSGSEPFYVRAHSLDPCGEPRHYFESFVLDGGEGEATGGELQLPMSGVDLIGRRMRATGTIEDDCGSCDFIVGGALCIEDLGASSAHYTAPDLTMLELFLAGGTAMGFAFPGVTPDLDLDGDGLESFETDADHHILRCVDGDRTVIEGRDCWRAETMADGFSLIMRYEMVSAFLVDREPGWETQVEGECEDHPAETLFDFQDL